MCNSLLVLCPDPIPRRSGTIQAIVLTWKFRILDYQSDYRFVILTCDTLTTSISAHVHVHVAKIAEQTQES